jgi:hypothetical protein
MTGLAAVDAATLRNAVSRLVASLAALHSTYG